MPLKEGNNQLVVKFYSGFDKEITWGIEPLKEWTLHRMKLSQVQLRGGSEYHRVSIRKANSESKVTPLRMNNIEIKL